MSFQKSGVDDRAQDQTMNAVTQKFLEQDPDLREARECIEAVISTEASVRSCPALVELRRDGFDCERWNRLHPEVKEQRVPYVTRCLAEHDDPVVTGTDYLREYADEIRGFMPNGTHYTVLGADGYGHNDTHPNPHNFFEIDRRWVVHAAITGGERRDVLAGCRVRDRHLEPQYGRTESVDSVRANVQWSVRAGRSRVDSSLRRPNSGSDLSW